MYMYTCQYTSLIHSTSFVFVSTSFSSPLQPHSISPSVHLLYIIVCLLVLLSLSLSLSLSLTFSLSLSLSLSLLAVSYLLTVGDHLTSLSWQTKNELVNKTGQTNTHCHFKQSPANSPARGEHSIGSHTQTHTHFILLHTKLCYSYCSLLSKANTKLQVTCKLITQTI